MSFIASLNIRAVMAGLVLLAACCNVTAQTLEQRVRAIEDEKEISVLLVMYGKHLDALQLTDFSKLFAREGSWAGSSSNFQPVKGPAAIQAMLEKSYEGRVYDPKRVSNVHVMSNAMITVKGDRATGYSRWTVLTRNEKGDPYVRHNGYYEDEYIREDGRWKFLTRVVQRDMP